MHKKKTPFIEVKQGDTEPTLTDTLVDSQGNGIDLSSVSGVKFYMENVRTQELVVEQPAVVEDAATGEVSYSFQAGDTSREGDHIAEWVVTFSDGGVQSFPPDRNLIVTVNETVARGLDLAEPNSPDATVAALTVTEEAFFPEGVPAVFGDNRDMSVRHEGSALRITHTSGKEWVLHGGSGETVFPGDLDADAINNLDLESLDLLSLVSDDVEARHRLSLPEYNRTADAPAGPVLFRVPPSGTDTAGVYHKDENGNVSLFDQSGGVSAGNLSGLTIDSDKDWGGHEIENVGRNGRDLPTNREIPFATFESGALPDHFGGTLSTHTVQNSVAQDGGYALKARVPDGTDNTWIKAVGDTHSPQEGDEFEIASYRVDAGDKARFWFGANDDSSYPKPSHFVEFDSNNVKFISYDGTTHNVASVSKTERLNEWLTAVVKWGEDNLFTLTLLDGSGGELGSDTGTSGVSADGEFWAFESRNTTAGEHIMYWDGGIVRRHSDTYVHDTKRGTVELGGDVVTPAGAIATGPHEAPVNAERTVHMETPVNADATAGTEAEIRDHIAGSPAGRYKYVHDGQGGAYGSRWDGALGRLARINANLSWDVAALSDLSAWSTDGPASFSFSLTGRPRRAQVSHDGTADGFGGFQAAFLTDYETLGPFRITFADVSVSENVSDYARIGISSDPVTTALFAATDSVFYDPGANGIKVENDGVESSQAGSNIDWTVSHDLAIEVGGSRSALYVDGELWGEVAVSPRGDMRPTIQLDDTGDNSTGETLEVGQTIVEAL